ncbi:MAG: bestrophin family ion channel, partial [Nannocystaceae bacterium]
MQVDNLRATRVAQIFFPHALGLTIWGALATAFHMASHKPEWIGLGQNFLSRLTELLHWGPVGIPFGAVGALGGALAIFLGFRNSSAYDRWWEARKIWGALVNDSRTWCRQVVAWTEAPQEASDPEREVATFRRELVHRHLAFVHGLAMHLRKQDTLQAKVAEFVSAKEAAHYQQVPNIPTAL